MRTATIALPEGYADAAAFAKDCGVALVDPNGKPHVMHSGITYSPAEWEIKCSIEKIEAQNARIIRNLEVR